MRLRPEHSESKTTRDLPITGMIAAVIERRRSAPSSTRARGQRFATRCSTATAPVLDFHYHYVEYPTIYHKDRVVGQIRAARAGESKDDTQKRGDREFMELQQSPFFRVWACAGADEILSALHRRLLLGASA